MLIKRSISAPFIATLIVFGSETAIAAENADSSFLPPIWPLLLLIFIVVVFRKQLCCAPAIDEQESTDKSASQKQASVERKELTVEIESTETKEKVENKIIDLKDNSGQCQASTAKGTRCKRKATLEEASISMDNKRYSLTVCKQHNTESLKPFSGLM